MDVFKKLGQLLSALGVNAIPAAGWLFEGWSSGTLLGVYWFENVASSLLVAARIAVQRRLSPREGHVHYHPRKDTHRRSGASFLSFFLPTALIFSAAHGFFLAVLIFALAKSGHGAGIGLDGPSLLKGCGLVSILLLVDFAIDLWNLRKRPFAWIERMGELNLGRVVVVHLTIILGLAAVAFTGANKSIFIVFFILKTLSDLAGYLPQWNPKVPPPWLCRVMDRLPNAYPGKTFAQFWAEDKAGEIARRAVNEEPLFSKSAK